MKQLADLLNGYLWSMPLIYLALGTGLILTFVLGLVQVRRIKDMVILLFRGESSAKGLSSFQAFSLALSGRVGTGNIAGVATAIATGGPGAIFWMWVLAFLGSATAFVECTMAQVFKVEIHSEYRGGGAFYIQKGVNNKIFGAVFAIAMGGVSLFLLPGIHANAIASSVNTAFGISPFIVGIIICVLLGIIIMGGSKRLGRVSEIVVPFMAAFYIIFALIIILSNITAVPGLFKLIITSAFGKNAIFGGLLGQAIIMGVKRGIYSSESGMGTATQSAGAAEVSHPAKQGLVQGFSVYVDTLFICTATALMILITNSYNVIDTVGNEIVMNLPGVEAGPAFAQAAIDTIMPFGSVFVAISLFFFAFTTIMNTYYNCETNVLYFFRRGGKEYATVINITRMVFIAAVMYGTIKTADAAWAFADVGIGIISWLNLVAVLLLSKTAMIVLKDYERQKNDNIDPVFDPVKLGIKNADFWENRIK